MTGRRVRGPQAAVSVPDRLGLGARLDPGVRVTFATERRVPTGRRGAAPGVGVGAGTGRWEAHWDMRGMLPPADARDWLADW